MTGDELREIRKRLGLSQTELAEILELRQASVSDMERGRVPIVKRTELSMLYLATREAADARCAGESVSIKKPAPPP